MISTFWLSQFVLAAGAAATASSAEPGATQAQATRAQLVFGDFNGDGLNDAVAQRPGGAFDVLENRGVAGFANVTRESGLGGVAFASCVLIEDFDGDGTADLFLGSASQRLWRGLGDGTFAPFEADLTHGEVDFVAGSMDMDKDGMPDLQLGTESGTLLYRNLGGGLFETVSLPLAPDSVTGAAPQAWSQLSGSRPAASASGAGQSSSPSSSQASPAASAEARRVRWMNAGAGAGIAGGGTSSASGFGASFPGFGVAVGIPAQAGALSGICAGTIEDQAGGPCLEASSVPALGSLHPLSTDFNVSPTGRVGIGTTAPEQSLHVYKDDLPGVLVEGKDPGLTFQDTDSGGARFFFLNRDGYLRLRGNGVDRLTVAPTGLVTVTKNLRVADGSIDIEKSGPNPDLTLRGVEPYIIIDDIRPGLERRWWMRGRSGELKFTDATAGADRLTIKGDGTVSVKQNLEIRGGADIVERFDATEEVESGTVMVIDPTSPGKLMPSAQAYDSKVAGVVSGAGGVNPGLCLSQDGSLDGETLVAMNGRVYVKATAANGAIQPGDLLTSSDLVGHCMKATDRTKSHGTVIGKAMSALESGEGLVLVLVNLQ